ncbi:hypothetical protein F4810DRAFT_162994 [Camillea tinctor]|nr:hypothetical protein F4810DRAFT_162994 [Camillea tinctor]
MYITLFPPNLHSTPIRSHENRNKSPGIHNMSGDKSKSSKSSKFMNFLSRGSSNSGGSGSSSSFPRTGSIRSSKSKATEAEAEAETVNRGTNPFDPPPNYLAATSASYNQPAMGYNSNESGSGVYPSSSSSFYPPGAHTGITLADVTNDDDQYAFLSTFDTVLLIDDSYSMTGDRWSETEEVLNALLPVCVSHDQDGIDLYFLNHMTRDGGDESSVGTGYRNVTEVSTVQRIFSKVRPTGVTYTGRRLRDILGTYMRYYEAHISAPGGETTCVKPINVIVITDGQPSDDPESIIVETAKRLDALRAPLTQLGVQFFQVGDDRIAAAALRELDDGLSGHTHNSGMRDIVDTTTFDASGGTKRLTADGILKVVLGSVVKRFDRWPTRRS